jgi:hypothetical protein
MKAVPIRTLSRHNSHRKTQATTIASAFEKTNGAIGLTGNLSNRRHCSSTSVSNYITDIKKAIHSLKEILMDVIVSVNLWFLLCLCLVFLVIGLIIGGQNGRYRY